MELKWPLENTGWKYEVFSGVSLNSLLSEEFLPLIDDFRYLLRTKKRKAGDEHTVSFVSDREI